MEKEMIGVTVAVDDEGFVRIVQDDDGIILHPEQVPLLIKWLRQAARG